MSDNGDKPGENGGSSGSGSWTPPYGAWGTLLNTVERMGKEGGVPSQIDRSYLSNLPGSVQTELLQSMKALGLIDEQLRPSRDLEILVSEEDGRGGVMKTIVEGKYEGPLGLTAFATQQQLEDEFRKYGISGNTIRKAIRFFLAAAKFADIPLSPHFRAPKVETTPRAPRKPRTPPAPPNDPKPPTPPAKPALDHHPLIEGLFKELPTVGADFDEEAQADWLALAKSAFKVIYKTPTKATRPSAPTAGGDDDS